MGADMRIEWDQNKFPRRSTEWESFVNELAKQQEQDDPYEDFWLEQKSEMDPLKSPGVGKVAKCILGMANRMPEVASRAMGGRGLMVCGLSKGKRIGVRRTEDHELENALHPFLGSEGPLWTAHRLPADDKNREVLVIVVDPPRDGDTIFACLKESDGVTNGGIYVRSKTETRSVRGQEHSALVGRLLAGSKKPELDISVELVTPLYAVNWRADLLDGYLSEREALMLEAVPALEEAPVPSRMTRDYGGIASVLFTAFERAETRSPAAYRKEVEQWTQSSRQAVGDVAREYLASALPGAVFKITNNAETYLKNVELKIHLEGAVESALHRTERKFRPSKFLPEAPRKYGPYTVQPYAAAPIGFPSSGYAGSNWQSGFRNSGSVDIVFSETALRPKSAVLTADDDSVLFLPNGKSGDEVVGTWTLTAEGIDAVFEGRVRIRVPRLLELRSDLFNDLVVDVPQTLRS